MLSLKTMESKDLQNQITLVECPRDAMQGWPVFIPTAQKISYLNQLLRVGFDVLDFGSFVSHKAIPQMADTEAVLQGLNLENTSTRLLAIVANMRGAEEAAKFEAIRYLGFPFSISETFQQLNTNKSIEESLEQVSEMQDLCMQRGKEMVIYISMGFGNPYGEAYHPDIAAGWVEKLAGMGIKTIALSDTVGMADAETIHDLFGTLIPQFPGVRLGAHFHAAPDEWQDKIEAAWAAGCRRYDSALKGIGGCPMSHRDLVGNMATENLVGWLRAKAIPLRLDQSRLDEALQTAGIIFN